MLYAIRRTHCDGVALPRDMVLHADPVIGNLLIDTEFINHRSALTAQLLHVTDKLRPELLPRLIRVQIEVMTDKGFLMSGVETVKKKGAMAEMSQGWWVTSAGGG